jgi:dTDP-4-amino-4,6-dideoxygalactose transaminase
VPPAGVSPAFSFLFVSMASRKQADRILAQSIDEGLGVSRLFAGPLTAYPALKGIIGPEPMPQAEALAARTLTVTTSPMMTDGEIETIGRLFRSAGREF